MQTIIVPKEAALGRFNSWMGGYGIFLGDTSIRRFLKGATIIAAHGGEERRGDAVRERI